jgi:hypothetical protein
MPKHPKDKRADSESDLWVAAKHSLKGPLGDRAWDTRVGGAPSHNRFLELADIALGLKKPESFRKRKTQTKEIIKTEPYSR